jgi:membrane protease YdiL (CAAX protease family)
MRALGPLIGYVAVVFLLGALLSYPVYGLLDSCCNNVAPFHKVVHRTLKLSALIALWPLMRWLRLSSRSQWGYGTSGKTFATDLSLGFLFGIGSLGLMVACLVLLDVRVLTPVSELTEAPFVALLAKVMVAALVIGFVEETWFRGALFSAISREIHPWQAVWVTAVLFGGVHFIRGDPATAPLEPTWFDGFVVIANSFHLFASRAFVDSFLALVAAGFLLGLMRQRSGHIAYCIGVHAGWVVVIKTTKKMSEVNTDSPLAFLVGGYDGVIGYLAFLVFSLLSVGYYGLAVKGTTLSQWLINHGCCGRSGRA